MRARKLNKQNKRYPVSKSDKLIEAGFFNFIITKEQGYCEQIQQFQQKNLYFQR